MGTRTTFEVNALQHATVEVVDALNKLFGRIKGWSHITEFQAYMEPINSNNLQVFIYPNEWSSDSSFISCRLHKTSTSLSADQGEVRADHLKMPGGGGKEIFSFSFDVTSGRNYFKLYPRKGDTESRDLFLKVVDYITYK